MTTRRSASDARQYRPASRPTTADPGSYAKVVALTERHERGEELWHEDDVELPPHRVSWRVPVVRMEVVDNEHDEHGWRSDRLDCC